MRYWFRSKEAKIYRIQLLGFGRLGGLSSCFLAGLISARFTAIARIMRSEPLRWM